MDRVVVASAPGKVNIVLRVGAPRADGFHPLDTVFEALDVRDDVVAQLAPELTMSITGIGEDLSVDDSNLVIRAAQLLKDRYGHQTRLDIAPADLGAHLAVTKRIPVAGGMAGGSADAAATLVALNELWQLGLEGDQLHECAAELGSDVPFALMGGLAHGIGRGEKLTAVSSSETHGWVMLLNQQGLSTPAVFCEFDRLGLGEATPDATGDVCSVLAGPARDSEHRVLLGSVVANDLEEPARSLRPDVAHIIDTIRAHIAAGVLGAHAVLLSGSGPTIAVLAEPNQLDSLAARLEQLFPGLTAVVATGPARGAYLVR
ncbi:4-(cytidine 5'-diphospho)-2-C-methyl-D-erythritol kinase [Arcanobacterium buesumense]|uniref:4-diphosphocytidyl-2-C-methyl-D-erythritol kinase n=2 Tax=Arcanobacterium buesumense TaxID=2722751 RepID=A0A6H2EMW7_9ACTO|nr:4-(cytidine 5'-diphospho)-2-C-methyl-D-erythritol kinase [Arcanobacterium buesumense]